METNNSVKYSQKALVIRQILYVKIVLVWVATNGHCYMKIAAIF